MRTVSDHTMDSWRAQVKAGNRRPVVRATIQAAQLRLTSYNTDYAPGGDYDGVRRRGGQFATILFGGNEAIREVPGIRSFNWGRSLSQQVAESTMTIHNAGLIGIGVDLGVDTYDLPGALTPRKGSEATDEAVGRWRADIDLGWNDSIRPDRLMKTFEGYGMDPEVPPALDPYLYQSGAWLIDEVTYSANGDLVLKSRDLGRLLLDQIAFPPVVPLDYYPLSWARERTDVVQGRAPTGGKWSTISGSTESSNELYVGEGIVDVPQYVDSTGTWQGHKKGYAIRGDYGLYWASTGQTGETDKVWWEVELSSPKALNALRIHPQGGPFKIYISIHNGTKWLGAKKIPYNVTTEGIDLGAGIPYVEWLHCDRSRRLDHVFKRKYNNITKIRLTFTLLRASGGKTYPWQAGLRDLRMYTGAYSSLGFGTGNILRSVGNVRDFSHIVRTVCAWAGFWWPDTNDQNYQRFSTFGDKYHYPMVNAEIAIPKGRVWGSYQYAGTAPIADLTADKFDKQPLMQSITEVCEMLGFNFYIDERGAPVFRMANLYVFGNWLHSHHLQKPNGPPRVQDYIAIDENDTLLDYTVRESSKNLREQVAVTDVAGKKGSVVRGYQPPGTPPNLRRLSLWSDGNFVTNRETRVAADLVASRQMFDYRRGKVTIWGLPAIQLDDQIRIFERTTNETYFHNVLGIDSNLDMENGTWDYTVETQWLGPEPDEGSWIMTTEKLTQETKDYLAIIGGVDDE